MKENALKGKWNGGQIPFGYMVKDSYLAIDETLAPIVRKLFEMCADGITVKDIHKYVQEKGILRPNGKKITYSSLRYLLSNRVYIGEYRHSGIIHENVVPAIVDKEVYDRAQEQISRTAHAPARHKAEDDYLLTLKLYCGHCGALMTAYAGTSIVVSGKTYTFTVTVDATAPTLKLEGVENGGKTTGGVVLSEPSETAEIKVYRGEEEIEYKLGETISEEGEYRVTITDECGNSTVYTFTIEAGTNWTLIILLVVLGFPTIAARAARPNVFGKRCTTF